MCDAASQEIINAMKDLKSFKQQYGPESKIVLSTPVVRVDKGNASDISKKYIDLLKGAFKWIAVSMIISSNTRV